MNIDIFEVKADEAWKSLIAESPYLLMSSRELEKCKNFFIFLNYKSRNKIVQVFVHFPLYYY